MAYQHQGSCASAGDTLELLAFDDEFDPLAVDDSEIDQEWMDDENPYDTIDYPTMRNMPRRCTTIRCTRRHAKAAPPRRFRRSLSATPTVGPCC